MPALRCYQVAVPSPLRRLFDYLPPPGCGHEIAAGSRVRVPFGTRELVGVVVGHRSHGGEGRELRAIQAVLDAEPLLSGELLALVTWAAEYYQCPLGEALASVFPSLLRQGQACPDLRTRHWQLSTHGHGLPDPAFPHAPRRQQLVRLLRERPRTRAELRAAGITAAVVHSLAKLGLIEESTAALSLPTAPEVLLGERPPPLHRDQQTALAAIELHGYHAYLLHGDTGTGKTEVYLRAIEKVLRLGRQALVLVPEIGLTPQTLARFTARFAGPVGVLHSGLGEAERARTWMQARDGHIGVLIGTRSAVFAPLPALGIVIVDEEHDLSYKQQDGFRYSARDVAVMRARRTGVPLLLGSATPALESLHNAATGRYARLRLTERPGAAVAPRWELVDLRRSQLRQGISARTLQAIAETLARGQQALVFLNRRGYAATLLCHDCAWVAGCPHCEARLTTHLRARHLLCHHCGHRRALPAQCPSCGGSDLQFLGQGTEKTEATLQALFPDAPLVRIDRDTVRSGSSLQARFDQIHGGGPCLLVGTQMLAKGHHFPNVTLAVILDADTGLMSADFRGAERLGQLLTQVAGRAGRGDQPGTVLIQSHYCDHPLLKLLVERGYPAFAEQLLAQRAVAGLPPFGALSLLRAEAASAARAEALLTAVRRIGEPLDAQVRFLGPLPAPMEKRGGRYRYLLTLSATTRGALQRLLPQLAASLETLPEARGVRWSIDADPQEVL